MSHNSGGKLRKQVQLLFSIKEAPAASPHIPLCTGPLMWRL